MNKIAEELRSAALRATKGWGYYNLCMRAAEEIERLSTTATATGPESVTLREALTAARKHDEAGPALDCWDTEDGEPAEGAARFASDWSHTAHADESRRLWEKVWAAHDAALTAAGQATPDGIGDAFKPLVDAVRDRRQSMPADFALLSYHDDADRVCKLTWAQIVAAVDAFDAGQATPRRAIDTVPALLASMREIGDRIMSETFTNGDTDPSWAVGEALLSTASTISAAAPAAAGEDIVQPPYKFLPDRWSRCPSTHCERRQECCSPSECSAAPPIGGVRDAG